jgi:hypothetical protein
LSTLNQIHPTTLVGIKRLANQLKSERDLPHTEALNAAAGAAGFQNFAHAQRSLRDAPPAAVPRHPVWLTAYWRDKELGTEGRESLRLELDAPWTTLIDLAKLKKHRGFSGFWALAPDHMEERYVQDSQSQARNMICRAARTFQFMDATGLQPSKASSRVFRGGTNPFQIPGRDHTSTWYDPPTKRYLCADEPYEAAIELQETERESWAADHGIEIARPTWRGMHYPKERGTQLYLLSQRGVGIPLGPIVEKLNRLPQPMIEQTWSGESAPRHPYFMTPRHSERLTRAPSKNPATSAQPKRKGDMPWGRKLLILATNHLLQNKLISLDGTDEGEQHCEAVIAGRNSIILWHDIGCQELRISIWWDYDHSKHPQANLIGNSKERFLTSEPLAKRQHYRRFVGAVLSGWLEREKGKYLQGKGKRGLFDLYRRQDAVAPLEALPVPHAEGFLAEGKFMI